MAGLPPRMAERAPELMMSSAPLPPPPDAHCARQAGMNPTRSPESDSDGTYVNIPKYTPQWKYQLMPIPKVVAHAV